MAVMQYHLTRATSAYDDVKGVLSLTLEMKGNCPVCWANVERVEKACR
jgi:hypothetical protein